MTTSRFEATMRYKIVLSFTDKKCWYCANRGERIVEGSLDKAKDEATRWLKSTTNKTLVPYQQIGDTHVQITEGRGGYSVSVGRL